MKNFTHIYNLYYYKSIIIFQNQRRTNTEQHFPFNNYSESVFSSKGVEGTHHGNLCLSSS